MLPVRQLHGHHIANADDDSPKPKYKNKNSALASNYHRVRKSQFSE